MDPAAETAAIEAVRAWRAGRDAGAVAAALDRLRAVARTTGNLMPATLECARAGVTTGEWAGALREVFGEYRPPTGLSSGGAEYLAYAKLGVNDLINRVEFRSSLLILVGHDIEDGKLQRIYEFRHLTFQEYLAAVAVAEGFYPNRTEADTILSVLKPHLTNEVWKEVIPLACVLVGRKTLPIVEFLTRSCIENENIYVPWEPIRILPRFMKEERTIILRVHLTKDFKRSGQMRFSFSVLLTRCAYRQNCWTILSTR